VILFAVIGRVTKGDFGEIGLDQVIVDSQRRAYKFMCAVRIDSIIRFE
jgi:hypothetical protein